MKKSDKLNHYANNNGCALKLLILLRRLKVCDGWIFVVPIDGFIEVYKSKEEYELNH